VQKLVKISLFKGIWWNFLALAKVVGWKFPCKFSFEKFFIVRMRAYNINKEAKNQFRLAKSSWGGNFFYFF
jgi:hypothetical protein